MPQPDWSLTLFTVVTQLVLGAFVVLWVTDLLAQQLADRREQEHLTAVGVWLLGPLMAAGLLAAALHLGRPQFALRALMGLSSSWLSREVTAVGAFFGLGAGYAFLWWWRRDLFALRAACGGVLAVVGGTALFAMSALYLLPARPTWYLVTTPLEFVATALLLGPLLVGAVFVTAERLRHVLPAQAMERLLWNRGRRASDPRGLPEDSPWLLPFHLRAMVWTTLAGALLVAVAHVLKWSVLAGRTPEGELALLLLGRDYGAWVTVRLWLFVLGAVALPLLLLFRLWLARGEATGTPSVLTLGHVWAMLGCVVGSELLGRALFYGTAIAVRPPGAFF